MSKEQLQTIKLYSKYEDDYIELIPLNHSIYKVDFTKNPYGYRIIYNEDNKTIQAFDPSGGPFISIGYEITPSYKVDSIYKDENTKDLLITVNFVK